MRALAAAAALAWILATGTAAAAAPRPALERVVVVMRHGVRPPTASNERLDKLSADPWPAWPVPPGELTGHGAETVRLMSAALRERYAGQGLLPKRGCPGEGQVVVRADGADQRTRKSGEVMAEAFAPRCGLTAPHGPDGKRDPIFSGGVCKIDPEGAREAILARAGGTVETPASRAALATLQSIVAPNACSGGPGVCLAGEDKVAGDRIEGPLDTAATLSENLLLEYWEGFEPDRVGWGRASAADLAAAVAAHERSAELTRVTPYVATRRGAPLARAILEDLEKPGVKLAAFAGHDTNLSNMAGAFGLTWSLKGEPDATAPATALAFELWRDAKGERFVRPVIYYETMDQLRTLRPARVSQVPLTFDGCADGPMGSCRLTDLRKAMAARLPDGC